MNFEELKKFLESTGLNAESISKIIADFGITPENMDKAKELLEQFGIKEVDQKSLEDVMKSFVDILPPEVKKQVSQLALEFEKFYPDMPMPEDIKKLLEKWNS